jgi:hypothetical protein
VAEAGKNFFLRLPGTSFQLATDKPSSALSNRRSILAPQLNRLLMRRFSSTLIIGHQFLGYKQQRTYRSETPYIKSTNNSLNVSLAASYFLLLPSLILR